MSTVQWIPLESNPEVLNKYAHSLGLSTEWNFMDVYSLDKELLAMLPSPVVCLLLVYPITEKSESEPFGELLLPSSGNNGVYFMKQTVSNACGTVALIHALANNRNQLKIETDSTLDKFLAKSKDSTPDERAKILESDEGLSTAHESAATEGQTAPDRESRTNLHYIALLHHGGKLLEFDGRRNGPVNHGDTTEADFLADCASLAQKFMARQADTLTFNIIALAKGESPF